MDEPSGGKDAPHGLKELLDVVKRTFSEFVADDCPRMAAALSYYTIFSLPPVLVLLLMIVGTFMDPAQVQENIADRMRELLGSKAAEQIGTVMDQASRPSGGIATTLLSVAALIFGATGALSQLQRALNRAWEVEFDPEAKGFRKAAFVVGKRLFSLAMVLVIAFLLLTSLVLSAAVNALAFKVQPYLPTVLTGTFLLAANIVVLLIVTTLLFAAIFKIMPDARVQWRHVWVGSFVTAVLFIGGMQVISIYIGRTDPGSAYGTAGALAVVLIWVYFSSLVLFLGAEFTQVWVRRRGRRILPTKHAVRVVEEKRVVREEGPRARGPLK